MANQTDISTAVPEIENFSSPSNQAASAIPVGQAYWYQQRTISARGSGDTTEIFASLQPPTGRVLRFTELFVAIESDSQADVSNFGDSAWLQIQQARANPLTREVISQIELQGGNSVLYQIGSGVKARKIYVPRPGQMTSVFIRPDPTTLQIKLCDGSGGTTAAATFRMNCCADLFRPDAITQWPPNYRYLTA